MTSYETHRLENIKRNQALLNELGISRTEKLQPSEKRAPAKKRKLSFFETKPSRASARIAAVPVRPSYNENDAPPRAMVVKKAPARRTNTNPIEALVDDVTQSSPPPTDLEDIRKGWTSWEPTAEPPQRDENSTFHFGSHPTFQPNKSPAELLAEGVFGGSYYRPLNSKRLRTTIADDWQELPQEWIADLDVGKSIASPEYDPEVNKYKVKCGQSIEEWEANGWIAHEYDIRGWFQWYTRFWMGRRCDDDDRQVGRWARCVGETGRWRRTLLKKYRLAGVRNIADEGEEEQEVSPVLHQTCLHWAWEIRQDILDAAWEDW